MRQNPHCRSLTRNTLSLALSVAVSGLAAGCASGPGQITAIRYWRSPGDAPPHVGRLWSSNGTLLASTTFTGESYEGWQQQALAKPISITAGTAYVVSVNISTLYPDTNWGLQSLVTNYGAQLPITNGDLSTIGDLNNGVFGNPGTFPTSTWERSNYFRDVVFVPGS